MQTFIPMSEVLKAMAHDRGYDKAGRKRRVTVKDLINLTDKQRASLASRLSETPGDIKRSYRRPC
jgi:hypothetical protein